MWRGARPSRVRARGGPIRASRGPGSRRPVRAHPAQCPLEPKGLRAHTHTHPTTHPGGESIPRSTASTIASHSTHDDATINTYIADQSHPVVVDSTNHPMVREIINTKSQKALGQSITTQVTYTSSRFIVVLGSTPTSITKIHSSAPGPSRPPVLFKLQMKTCQPGGFLASTYGSQPGLQCPNSSARSCSSSPPSIRSLENDIVPQSCSYYILKM